MTESPFIMIAVDGAAASGKSSTARALARRFGLLHVDTGSFYRALTLLLIGEGYSPQNPAAVRDRLDQIALSSRIEHDQAHMAVGGRIPLEEDLRSKAVNETVSEFAAIPEVRRFLFDYQRGLVELAREREYSGIVMEGRDIGSVILPEADLKIFLEADPDTRDQRRQQEGWSDSLSKRDRIDSQRKSAPLTRPDGAIIIDTSERDLNQVVDRVAGEITQRGLRVVDQTADD